VTMLYVTCPCCQQKNMLSHGWGLCLNCGCQWGESKRKPGPEIGGCEGLNLSAYREVLAALEDLLSSYGYAYSGKDYQAAFAAFAKAKGN
jgi:hypothetical protein